MCSILSKSIFPPILITDKDIELSFAILQRPQNATSSLYLSLSKYLVNKLSIVSILRQRIPVDMTDLMAYFGFNGKRKRVLKPHNR
jgi:hypothetical protein